LSVVAAAPRRPKLWGIPSAGLVEAASHGRKTYRSASSRLADIRAGIGQRDRRRPRHDGRRPVPHRARAGQFLQSYPAPNSASGGPAPREVSTPICSPREAATPGSTAPKADAYGAQNREL